MMQRMMNGGSERAERVTVTPGGTAAVAQQNPANQLTALSGMNVGRRPFGGGRARRRNGPKRRAPTRYVPRTRKNKPAKRAHLKKGSPAAKRFMAKLRRMQKKRRR